MYINIDDLLRKAISRNASDLHIKAGQFPILRIEGELISLREYRELTADDTEQMASQILSSVQTPKTKDSKELDIAYSLKGMGRFRVNVFNRMGTVSIALRVICPKIKTIEELRLPLVLKEMALEPRGMILVTGTTGSGKSTTLAAMVDHINNNRKTHIITIEDPIEYVHEDKYSIINQREIGQDTNTFSDALRAALRQDPDVILVGEMRDTETIGTALTAAETGHMVFSTLHTTDATETIVRIIAVFPPHQQQQIRIQLSGALRGVVSQRLIPRADGNGRAPAVEIMRVTKLIQECIMDPMRTAEIPDAIKDGVSQYRMQTFDQSLFQLFSKGYITLESALAMASNPADFKLRIEGIGSAGEDAMRDMESVMESDTEELLEDDIGSLLDSEDFDFSHS